MKKPDKKLAVATHTIRALTRPEVVTGGLACPTITRLTNCTTVTNSATC